MAQKQDNNGISENGDLGAQLDALAGQLRHAEPNLVKNALNPGEEQSDVPPLPETVTDTPPSQSPEQSTGPNVTEPPQAAEATDDSVSASEADLEQLTMDAIDALLADQANDAVTGEFETINDVLAAKQAEMGRTDQPLTDQLPVERQGADPPPQDEEEQYLEGTFDTPKNVIEDDPAEGSSQSIARELDEQPEAIEIDASKNDESTGPKSILEDSADPEELGKKPIVAVLTAAVKHGSYVTNLPISRLSESKRQLVGYVAMLTLFNGAMWFGFNLIKAMFASN